ncbi:MAG TPA: hypothetical protein VH299_00660 [Solirubrobacterales bacterium]|nr:hypothetical protein [Solirubrobacterales bacterium]
MIPSDFAGIFSRYFVIGFFLPVFFALVVVAHLVELSSTPGAYASASGGTQVVILGGAGLLCGLLLLGINQYIIRIFAGYPLQGLINSLASRPNAEGALPWLLYWPTLRHLAKRMELQARVKEEQSTDAAVKLNQYFPWQANEVMPTRLGNAIRAFESYPFKTYGLDGPPNWARVEALITENEKEAITEALTTFAFWLNISVLAPAAATYISVGVTAGSHSSTGATVILVAVTLAVGIALSWGAYCAAVGAAIRWGVGVRAAYDLHRLELYVQLGLKRPRTAAEERLIARSANRAASFGEELVGAVRNNSGSEGSNDGH